MCLGSPCSPLNPTFQATFSLSFWPFSIKLLWAPLVDSLYLEQMGRRKSWLVPSQYLIGKWTTYCECPLTPFILRTSGNWAKVFVLMWVWNRGVWCHHGSSGSIYKDGCMKEMRKLGWRFGHESDCGWWGAALGSRPVHRWHCVVGWKWEDALEHCFFTWGACPS